MDEEYCNICNEEVENHDGFCPECGEFLDALIEKAELVYDQMKGV